MSCSGRGLGVKQFRKCRHNVLIYGIGKKFLRSAVILVFLNFNLIKIGPVN